MLSGICDNLIGPSLSNASRKTRKIITGQIHEADVQRIFGLGWCDLSMASCTQVEATACTCNPDKEC